MTDLALLRLQAALDAELSTASGAVRSHLLVQAAELGATQEMERLLATPLSPQDIGQALLEVDWATQSPALTRTLPALLARLEALPLNHPIMAELAMRMGEGNQGPALDLLLTHTRTSPDLPRDPADQDLLDRLLRYAARQGAAATAATVLAWRARPQTEDGSALEAAAAHGHVGVVRLLMATHEPALARALAKAARHGHLACVEALAPAVSTPDLLQAALMEAAEEGEAEVCAFLAPRLSKGHLAAVNRATEHGYVAAVQALLPHLDVTDSVEKALCLAATRGHLAVVEVLLSRQPPTRDLSETLEGALNQDAMWPGTRPSLVPLILSYMTPRSVLKAAARVTANQQDRLGMLGNRMLREALIDRFPQADLKQTRHRLRAEQRQAALAERPVAPLRPRRRS